MTQPRVVICSMWRNDLHRRIVDRVEHLLAKAELWPNTRYVWVVGDSTDGTAGALAELSTGYDVRIIDMETGIEGDDATNRLRRLSATANEYFAWCDGAEYVLIHESDLLSPYDLVPRMVGLAERGICPVAGWPVLEWQGRRILYDTLCYRRDGVRFTHDPPYHACYRADAPFVVDSFGSVFLMDARDARHIHMRNRAVLDLCDQLRQQGRMLWVDPTLEVIQPADLWQFHSTKEYA
jgi:hypothetical protein